jgi:hypothetical protein
VSPIATPVAAAPSPSAPSPPPTPGVVEELRSGRTEEAPGSARGHFDDAVAAAPRGGAALEPPRGLGPKSLSAGTSQASESNIVVENLETTGEWDASSKTAEPAADDEGDPLGEDECDGDDAERGLSRATPDAAPPGSAMTRLGCGGSASDATCPPLHCTSCNHGVLRFRGHRWHGDTDYMHFRNFAGHSYDLAKLRYELVADDDRAAYCCQCSWQSVADWKPLDQWGSDPGSEGGAANGSLRWKKAEKKKGASAFGR